MARRYNGFMLPRTIVAVITDLMFQSRLREQVLALGYGFALADTAETLAGALDSAPALVVLDLQIAGIDWRLVVGSAKERRVPILAFGRHTEAQLLGSARDAGCDRVVPRSTFVEELPQLIKELAPAGA